MFSIEFISRYFHWYGFLIGLGVVVALELSERKAREVPIAQNCWRIVVGFGLGFGIVGARLWHVATDFQLYVGRWQEIFYLWQGGLSIVGGIAFGLLGVAVALRFATCKKYPLRLIMDLLAFGAPFGQGIGRWGNWVNQELYGLPTTLPWGLYIPPDRRVAEYMNNRYYHPLFFYEFALLFGFGIWLWWWSARKKWELGSGKFAAAYLMFYSVIRFLLEFMRVEKAQSMFFGLSVNQVVMLGVIVAVSWWLRQNWRKNDRKE